MLGEEGDRIDRRSLRQQDLRLGKMAVGLRKGTGARGRQFGEARLEAGEVITRIRIDDEYVLYRGSLIRVVSDHQDSASAVVLHDGHASLPYSTVGRDASTRSAETQSGV